MGQELLLGPVCMLTPCPLQSQHVGGSDMKEDDCKFEADLIDMVSSWLAWATRGNLVSKQNKKASIQNGP